MADLTDKTFTIRITEKADGKVSVWTKGMPDTRTFGGKPWADAPKSHLLGLFALGRIHDAIEAQEWELDKEG